VFLALQTVEDSPQFRDGLPVPLGVLPTFLDLSAERQRLVPAERAYPLFRAQHGDAALCPLKLEVVHAPRIVERMFALLGFQPV
jgi:hypothetical protein